MYTFVLQKVKKVDAFKKLCKRNFETHKKIKPETIKGSGTEKLYE